MVKSILIINGTTRDKGNTDAIIEKLIEGAEAVDLNIKYFKLRDLNVANCIGCCTCKDESKCFFQDNMTEIREYINKSDLLILASPIYWCEITGLMKTFMDRLYFYHHSNNSALISGKKAIIITTMGEANNIEYESEVLVEFYKRALKSLQVEILDMLFFSDLMEKEAILKKPEYLEKAYDAGKDLKTMIDKTLFNV
ncbi:MAG: flavodoxin family protein [bacterium]|nr:MAG: flavodoxin family protein [bacterium]